VFTVEDPTTCPSVGTPDIENTLPELDITEEMVAKKLKCLNPYKSPGPDCMYPKVLKEAGASIKQPLTSIFRTSVREGKIPKQWKVAHISAIFKKGNKSDPLNYRPVSLTSIVCKILESIIRDHVVAYIKSVNKFSSKQFGFIQGRSTVLQLLQVIDEWTKILDTGGTVNCIYMDFKKAFDTVPHHRLLKKVESFGIKGPILKWIKDFLSGRCQHVVINGEKSQAEKVTSGIPQGSVLGPLLFVLFINDLPDNIKSQVFMFADDTKLYREVTSIEDQTQLQIDLDKLQDWSNKWLLKFHPGKCKVLRIGTKTGLTKVPYKMVTEKNEVIELEESSHEKDIGVIIDDKLNFEAHISEKVNTANRIAGTIRRTYEHLDEESFALLFKALVRPHLEYANSVWCPYKKKDITKVENVQRRASKLIPTLRNLPYEERLRKLKLPSLTYRRARGDMIEVFKIRKGLYDPEVSNFLPETNKHTTRGHDLKIFKQRGRLNLRKYSFCLRVVDRWNELPDDVIGAKDVRCFERMLDKFWLHQNGAPSKYTIEKNTGDADEMDIEAELT